MDLISGLAAVSQAVQLVKDIKGIDRSVDEAAFKLKLAELTVALADTKIALSDAKVTILQKDEELNELKRRLETLISGEACPICGVGTLKVVSSRPHPTFGDFGHQERTLKCSSRSCGHTEKRHHDPSGKS